MDYKGLKETLEGFLSSECDQYPDKLDDLLSDTARTGIVRLPWKLLKPLLLYRLQQVLNDAYTGVVSTDDQDMPQQLQDKLIKFENPPFTIQRICELIIEPQKQYKKRDKYMRAMEKCLMVVSTQEPDLTWMKSPRLTQLLEEPPKEPVMTNSKHHYDNSQEEEEEMNTEQPSSQSDLNTSGMDLDTPPTRDHVTSNERDLNSNLSKPESSTPSEPPSTVGESCKGSEDNMSSLPRKRTSSIRDSLDEGTEQDVEMSPVLQEADSTTVSIEQDHLPPVKFERQNSIPHTEVDNEEEPLEQSVFKRMKPASPTPVFSGVNMAELESEQLGSKTESVQETSNDQQQQQQEKMVESQDSGVEQIV